MLQALFATMTVANHPLLTSIDLKNNYNRQKSSFSNTNWRKLTMKSPNITSTIANHQPSIHYYAYWSWNSEITSEPLGLCHSTAQRFSPGICSRSPCWGRDDGPGAGGLVTWQNGITALIIEEFMANKNGLINDWILRFMMVDEGS